MNILRNIATLIIAKHLNIFKFYISSNTNDIYIHVLVSQLKKLGILKKNSDMIYIND